MHRRSEITAQGIAQVEEVLDRNRLVEIILLPDLLDLFFRSELACNQPGRVTGYEARDEEDNGDGEQNDRYDRHYPLQDPLSKTAFHSVPSSCERG